MNTYTPPASHNGVTLSTREKSIAASAFQAGREYEASLFSAVINTIVKELQRYRAATKEG
jgi:hypothetical protein